MGLLGRATHSVKICRKTVRSSKKMFPKRLAPKEKKYYIGIFGGTIWGKLLSSKINQFLDVFSHCAIEAISTVGRGEQFGEAGNSNNQLNADKSGGVSQQFGCMQVEVSSRRNSPTQNRNLMADPSQALHGANFQGSTSNQNPNFSQSTNNYQNMNSYQNVNSHQITENNQNYHNKNRQQTHQNNPHFHQNQTVQQNSVFLPPIQPAPGNSSAFRAMSDTEYSKKNH